MFDLPFNKDNTYAVLNGKLFTVNLNHFILKSFFFKFWNSHLFLQTFNMRRGDIKHPFNRHHLLKYFTCCCCFFEWQNFLISIFWKCFSRFGEELQLFSMQWSTSKSNEWKDKLWFCQLCVCVWVIDILKIQYGKSKSLRGFFLLFFLHNKKVHTQTKHHPTCRKWIHQWNRLYSMNKISNIFQACSTTNKHKSVYGVWIECFSVYISGINCLTFIDFYRLLTF